MIPAKIDFPLLMPSESYSPIPLKGNSLIVIERSIAIFERALDAYVVKASTMYC